MKKQWEVDAQTVVQATWGGFGKLAIRVNGQEVARKRLFRATANLPFRLPDGRPAHLQLKREYPSVALDLEVGGRFLVESGKAPIKCKHCGEPGKPYDRFCLHCRQAMPTAQEYSNAKHVRAAGSTIATLSVLYLVFGLIMFFVVKNQADGLLAQMHAMSADARYPNTSLSVGAVRAQLSWQPWHVLISNLILAALMGALALWSRRAPLEAVIVAAATYLVVNVVNAVQDPRTLGQGIYVKIFVVIILFRGVKAALALRTSNA
jgi:hypothetical protein